MFNVNLINSRQTVRADWIHDAQPMRNNALGEVARTVMKHKFFNAEKRPFIISPDGKYLHILGQYWDTAEFTRYIHAVDTEGNDFYFREDFLYIESALTQLQILGDALKQKNKSDRRINIDALIEAKIKVGASDLRNALASTIVHRTG